jgi:hypothetical protein
VIVKPCEGKGEKGYWEVTVAPMTTEEVRAMIEYLEEDGWLITNEGLPVEFHREDAE